MIPKWLFQELREFYLRGMYGWAPSDTWSLDHYLDDIFIGALPYLAKHTHGFPMDETEESLAQCLNEIAAKIKAEHDINESDEWSVEKVQKLNEEKIAALYKLVDRWNGLWA